MAEYHKPVLLHESIDGLNIKPEGIYIDATYGGGGHSKEILKKLKTGKLISFDRDADAIENVMSDERLTLIRDNFSNIESCLHELGIDKVDGVLADLGISSHQIDEPARGFSTRFDADLDMRMDRRSGLTAKAVINNYKVADLVKLFSDYGEIRNARTLAQAIDVARDNHVINTTGDLKNAIKGCVPAAKEHQYFARVFQALRIVVNEEMEALRSFLTQCKSIIRSGGRLVVISYHSLEDRMVKNLIATGNTEGAINKDVFGNTTGLSFISIHKKPLVPGSEEIGINPRSRSAKLRVAGRI
jgi:16S rRNA (cytosine1402-N4)-methyltransferase